jgi:hypothetical protein
MDNPSGQLWAYLRNAAKMEIAYSKKISEQIKDSYKNLDFYFSPI